MTISDVSGFSPLRGLSRPGGVAPAAPRTEGELTPATSSRPQEVPPPSGRLGSEVAARLEAAVDNVRDRLSQFASGEGLNSDQVARLREAEENVQATLDRVRNALDGGGLAPTTVRQGFRAAIGELRSAVQEVFGEDGGAVDGANVSGFDVANVNQAGVDIQAERAGGSNNELPNNALFERIGFAEERLSGRVDELLASQDLSEEQRASLLESREGFEATFGRLRNAIEGGAAPVTVARGFRAALGEFREGINAITGAGDEGSAGRGDIVSPATARRLEGIGDAGDRIGQRIDNLISREGLGEDQITALEEARAGFEAALQELRSSVLDSNTSIGDLRSAFNDALDGLVQDVRGALNEEASFPAVYTSDFEVDQLSAGQGDVLDERG